MIDNDVYDRLGDDWWNDRSPLNLLHGSVTPARYAYFRDLLARHGARRLHGLRALDVGSGGGFLAEEFARAGARVVGIDPSGPSRATAAEHARRAGLDIDYVAGVGEDLPVADGAFDIVYCCDVLEHVDDVGVVVAEIGRVLRPGGVFLFDTINRTWLARLFVITLMQDFGPTRMFDTPIHEWSMFVTPGELTDHVDRHGLRMLETTGLGLRTVNPKALWDMHRARGGHIGYGELSRRLRFGRVPWRSVSYMGGARRDAA